MRQLLSSFTAGFITNSYGEKIILSKCIVFMTSSIHNNRIGFMNHKVFTDSYSKVKHIISFEELNEKSILSYLRVNGFSKDLIRSDWKNQGFYALEECFPKETV